MGRYFTAAKLICAASLAFASISSAALSKATEIAANMGFGYNLGNTLEVPEDPTAWGNSWPTQALFDSIKAAGFSSVRLPTAWYTHSTVSGSGSSGTYTINSTWLDSVASVVDMCINNGLYVVLNSHWDNGWLEDNVFPGTHTTSSGTETTDTATVRAMQEQYWTQIATKFASYDEHLLFAGANEPGVNDAWVSGAEDDYDGNGQVDFNSARAAVLQSYQQAFIDAVRGTGGNNATRTLIIQVPRAESDFYDTLLAALPTDNTNNSYDYMMTEFHYYPYNFSLMESDESWGNAYYYLGEENLSTTDTDHNAPTDASEWCSPGYMQTTLQTAFDKSYKTGGMPVIIGEFGAIKRTAKSYGLDSANLTLHLQSRAYFYNLVASEAYSYGYAVPFLWDTGDEGTGNMTVIRRQNSDSIGYIFDYEVLNAMRSAYGLSELDGNSIDALVSKVADTTNYALYTEVSSDDNTDSASTTTIRVTPDYTDWSDYDYITVVMLLYGEGVSCSSTEYPWASADFFLMSGDSWTWSQYNLTSDYSDSSYVTYTFKISDLANATIADQSDVLAIGINLYSQCWDGVIIVDGVYLSSASDVTDLDTAYAFSELITLEGNYSNTKLVTVGSVLDESTLESVTDTTNYAVITEISNSDTSTYTMVGVSTSITDWSSYDSVSVVMLLYGTTECSTSGSYGWTSASLSTMSGSTYSYVGYNFTASTSDSSYVTYTFAIDDLEITDETAVYYVAVNIYSQCFEGVLALDGIYLISSSGTVDTLNAFSDTSSVDLEGDVGNTKIVSVADGSTKTPIKSTIAAVSNKIQLSLHDGLITAVFESSSSRNASVMLTNSLGQVVSKKSFRTRVGSNTVNLTTPFRGAGYLVIKNGSSQSAVPIRIKE